MSIPTITIDTSIPCSRCGQMGATNSGLCLGCVAREVTKGVSNMADDHAQMSLTTQYVELTEAEKVERGWQLASLLREADLMDEEHAERKKEMKEERVALAEKIAALAAVVRTGKEERPVAR